MKRFIKMLLTTVILLCTLLCVVQCVKDKNSKSVKNNQSEIREKEDIIHDKDVPFRKSITNRFRIMKNAMDVGYTVAVNDRSSSVWSVSESTFFKGVKRKSAEYLFDTKARTITQMDINSYTGVEENRISMSRDNSSNEYNVTYVDGENSVENTFVDEENTFIFNENMFQSYEFAIQSMQSELESLQSYQPYSFLSMIPSSNRIFETKISKEYEEKLNINGFIMDTIVFSLTMAGDNQQIWVKKDNFKIIKIMIRDKSIEIRRVIKSEEDREGIREKNLIKGKRNFKLLSIEDASNSTVHDEDHKNVENDKSNEDGDDGNDESDENKIDDDVTKTDETTSDEVLEGDKKEANNYDETDNVDSIPEDNYFDEDTKLYEISTNEGVVIGFNRYTIINTNSFQQVIEQTVMKADLGNTDIENRYHFSYIWNKNSNSMASLEGSINYGNDNALVSLNEINGDYTLIKEGKEDRKQLKLMKSEMSRRYLVLDHCLSSLEIIFKDLDISRKLPIKVKTINPETLNKEVIKIKSVVHIPTDKLETAFSQIKIVTNIGNKRYNIYLNKDDRSLYKMEILSDKITLKLSDKENIVLSSNKSSVEGLLDRSIKNTGISLGNVASYDYIKFDHIKADIKIYGMLLKGNTIDYYLDNKLQTFDGVVDGNVVEGSVDVNISNNTIYVEEPFPPKAVPESVKKYQTKPSEEAGVVDIPYDNEVIKKLANETTELSKTVFKAAESIIKMIRTNIAHDKATNVDALKALEMRKGSSRSQAQLAIAMLRAVGIPARVVGGLLYGDLYDGTFGQHYWIEIWSGEKTGWIMMDPVTGETDRVNPLHISLWRWETLSREKDSAVDISIIDTLSE